MRGKVRATWVVLTIVSLISLMALGWPVIPVSGFQSAPAGSGEIDGPLHLEITVSPVVATPRDAITLELVLTNDLEETVAPEVVVTFPGGLTSAAARFPAGTNFNYQDNSLNWLPIVQADGGVQQLSMPFRVAVADMLQPEQRISVELRYDGSTRSTAVTYWVGITPSAIIQANPPVAAVGQPIQLRAQTEGPGPFTQSWNLGDGRQVDAHNPTIVYAAPGTYQVTLQVANPLAIATTTQSITIVAQPTAAFSVEDDRPVAQQPVHFTNQSGGQPPLGYLWDFGDGTTSSAANPTHQYSAPGNYEVRLVVQSEHGQAETGTFLTVGTLPTADVVMDTAALTGQVLTAEAVHDGSVSQLRWDMGDGVHYEGALVDHVYHNVGDFLVTLTAANEFGESQVTRWVHVDPGTFNAYLPAVASESPLPAGAQPDGTAPASPVAGEEAATAETPAGPPPTPATGILEEPVATPTTEQAAVQEQAVMPTVPSPPTAAPLQQQESLKPDAAPAEQLLWYINEARRLHGLPALTYNYELSIAAQMHTVDMAANPDLMHVGSDGSRPAERQLRYGYAGAYGGEAVAWGWESAVPVVEFWVNSPPHRALILNPYAQEVGVGFTADGTAPNLWYWAAEFGIRPEAAPAPEGS